MPASTSAIMKNVSRMADDAELLKLWNDAATSDRTPGQAWLVFTAAADAARIADRIPGSVGRSFKASYAAEAEESAPAKRTAPAKKEAGK